MKRSLLVWQVFGLTFSAVLGTLLHFLYDWTDLKFLKPISAINESTFEHMKILFFPMLIFAIIQSFYFRKEYGNYWCVKLIGTIIGVFLIPMIFYTLGGVFGKLPDVINILIFFISAGIGYLAEGLMLKNEIPKCKRLWIPISILILLAYSFVIFTYFPLNIPIFIDPRTLQRGETEALSGAPYISACLTQTLGGFGPIFITIAMVLFAFTTLIGNLFYVDKAVLHLMGKEPSKIFKTIYYIVFSLLIFLGAGLNAGLLWDISDIFMGCMAIINVPVIIILGKYSFRALNDYIKQKKAGKTPTFLANSIGLTDKVDYWQEESEE